MPAFSFTIRTVYRNSDGGEIRTDPQTNETEADSEDALRAYVTSEQYLKSERELYAIPGLDIARVELVRVEVDGG